MRNNPHDRLPFWPPEGRPCGCDFCTAAFAGQRQPSSWLSRSPLLWFSELVRVCAGAAVRFWLPQQRVCVSHCFPAVPTGLGLSRAVEAADRICRDLALNSRGLGEEWSSVAVVSQSQLVTAHQSQLVNKFSRTLQASC